MSSMDIDNITYFQSQVHVVTVNSLHFETNVISTSPQMLSTQAKNNTINEPFPVVSLKAAYTD
jgi:hypothetical protein